jgi:yecA family protein
VNKGRQALNFDMTRERTLLDYLQQLEHNDAVLSYYQLQGLLFAMACSPEPIGDAEWFELIWLDDEPQFDDEAEARHFYHLAVSLSVSIKEAASQHSYNPFAETYSGQWQSELSQWCDGFLLAHQYLEDLWVVAIETLSDQLLADDINSVLSLATTFADLEYAQQMSFEEGVALTDEYLPEAYKMLWRVLDSYAGVRQRLAAVDSEFDAEQLFLALESVDRNELCPCGSGEIFARCCLH